MVRRRFAGLLVAVATLGACSGPPGDASPDASPAVATSYTEFHDSFCSAFDDLFRAIGNPDAGSDSELMKRLDQAIAAGDQVSADRLAAEITAILESARAHARFGGGWAPTSASAVPFDQVLVAFERYVEAKRSTAGQGLDAAEQAGQSAFERAEGVKAWTDMLRTFQDPTVMAAVASARPAGADPKCPTVPISL